MKTLCIVQCGDKKIWDKNPNAGPTIAKQVYIGRFAKKIIEYAERFHPADYCILSAKHGFLLPLDIIPGPYNVSFKNKKSNPIKVRDLLVQLQEKKLNTYQKIIIITSRVYANIIKEIFSGKEICEPLNDCRGIGYMMEKLKNSIDSGVPL